MNSDFENSDDVVGVLLLRGLIVFFTVVAELAKEIVVAGRDHHQLVTTWRCEHGVVRTQRGGIAEEVGPIRNAVGQLVVIDFVQVDFRMPEKVVFAKTDIAADRGSSAPDRHSAHSSRTRTAVSFGRPWESVPRPIRSRLS